MGLLQKTWTFLPSPGPGRSNPFFWLEVRGFHRAAINAQIDARRV